MMSESESQTNEFESQTIDTGEDGTREEWLSVPLFKMGDGADHSRENCPLPHLCAWHRPALHLVVCPTHGSRYLDLAERWSPEEMCPDCRVQSNEPARMVETEAKEISAYETILERIEMHEIGAYETILERIEMLAERWSESSRRYKEWYDQYTNVSANGAFRRSCYQRYVDFERRAMELRNVAKYMETGKD